MDPAKPDSPSPAGSDKQASDRRDRRRVQMTQPIRVRSSQPGWVGFDEVQATLNVCRDGLYFSTHLTGYRKGMVVQVTYPYSDMPGAINSEHPGEVVRVDRLTHGRNGIAIHLQGIEDPRLKKSPQGPK